MYEYRQVEYNYFLQNQPPEDGELKFSRRQNPLVNFESVVKIDKLKKIMVQTSFTRQEPIDVDSILVGRYR